MKKVFLSVLFVSLAWAALSQPIIARSGPANTVQDARATWLYNAFLPRFTDTTAANIQKGIDSCGAVIFTYDINGLWFRQCSPKKWIMLNNSSPYSSSGWNVGGNLFPVTVIPSRNIGTLAPYGGAIGLMTNSVTRLILPDYGLIYSNSATDSFLGRDIDGNLVLKTASGGGGVTNITYSNLVTAISGSTLIPGITYKITDRGDRGLFFKAVSSNELAKDGTRLMLCPSDYAIETDAHGNVWKGIWASFKTASVNNLMIWGGKVYKNLTGSIGTATNDTLLDVTNWVAISKSSFTNYEYTEMSFGVNFDIANDWIEKQWDGKGNVITEPYYWSQNYYGRFIGNGCSITDWNLGSEFYNNTAMAVFNNADIYAIYNNICKSNAISNNVMNPYAGSPVSIARNLCVDGIIGNYIGGGIYDNLVYQIARNKVSFDINDNVVTAVIADDTVSSIRANYVSTSIFSVYGPSYSVTGSFTNKDITGVISSNYTELTIENLPSGVGTKQVRYNPSTGNFTYTDTTGGGSSGADTSIYTYNGTLTGNRTLTGADNNLTFSGVGIYAITQSNKTSVSGSSGTNNVAPFTLTGGNGGASSYSTGTVVGGSAGNININGGQGGAITGTPTTGIGGTGSSINLVAGDGGLGTTNGGQGGNTEIAAGAGGAGTAGGTPGYVAIKGGFAGLTGNADGGHIYISPGAKNGSGADGHIFLGLSPSGVVRGSATIGSTTKGDSLFNIKSGGLYADRGVRFPNTPLFADTTNYKPVVMNSSGTLYKATYWPGGGGSGVTGLAAIGSSPNANGATISGSTLNLQPASASFGGVVTTGTQTMAGNKTFSGAINVTDSVYINNNTSTADKWNLRLVNSNTSGNTGIYFGSSNFSQESRIYNTSNGSMIYEGGGYNGHYFTTYNGVDRKVYGRIGQGALFSTSTDISAYAVTVNGVASTIAAIDGGGLYVGNGAVFNQNQSSSGDITIKGQTDADLTFWDVSKDEMYIGVNTSSDAGAYKVQSTTGYFGTSVTSPAFYTVGTSSGSVKLQSATGTYTLTLPTTDGNASEFLQTDGSGNLTWAAASGGGAISALTAATGSNTIDNTNYGQTWNWSTLAGNSALKLGTTSTAANGNAQRMLEIAMGGANVNPQTTYGIYSKNAHTGTGSVNVALYAEASSGATNYAIVVPSSGGYVGIGTSTPTTLLEVSGQATTQAAISGTTARFTGTDAAPLRLSFDTHNSTDAFGSQLFGRRSRGTSASPSALSAGDVLFAISGTGYGTSQYTASSTGLIAIKANQTFTNANAGTYIAMFTTPDNSVTAAEVARFNATNLTLGVTGTMAGSLKFSGSGTGVVTITTQATAGTYTLTLPNSAGSSGQYLQTDGSGGLSWQTSATGTGQTFQQVMGTTLMRIF